MGDARLTLERQHLSDDEKYGILVVDAFSSDAIPIHLLTREAVRLYLDRVRPDGFLLFHISQRYLDLRPVLANLAADSSLGGYVFTDDGDPLAGKAASTWVALLRPPPSPGRHSGLAEPTALGSRTGALEPSRPPLPGPWQPLVPAPEVGVWTDDYSNLLSVFKWR
jgi:hypothetical protein